MAETLAKTSAAGAELKQKLGQQKNDSSVQQAQKDYILDLENRVRVLIERLDSQSLQLTEFQKQNHQLSEENQKLKIDNDQLQSTMRISKMNYQKQTEAMRTEVEFLKLTKTRYPKFLDKPELYGANWELLNDIPKLAKAVKDQAVMNQALAYQNKCVMLTNANNSLVEKEKIQERQITSLQKQLYDAQQRNQQLLDKISEQKKQLDEEIRKRVILQQLRSKQEEQTQMENLEFQRIQQREQELANSVTLPEVKRLLTQTHVSKRPQSLQLYSQASDAPGYAATQQAIKDKATIEAQRKQMRQLYEEINTLRNQVSEQGTTHKSTVYDLMKIQAKRRKGASSNLRKVETVQ